MTAETPAAELKLACRARGIGATGSKTVLFKRLVRHMWRRKMEDDLALFEAAKLPERNPRPAAVPDEPTAEERAKHLPDPYFRIVRGVLCASPLEDGEMLTEVRNSHRTTGGWPVLSMDLMYASTQGSVFDMMKQAPASKDKKLMVLVCVDRDTGMVHSVPLPGKDMQALQRSAKEVLGFLSYLGRSEVEIRGDNEPPWLLCVTRLLMPETKLDCLLAKLLLNRTNIKPMCSRTGSAEYEETLAAHYCTKLSRVVLCSVRTPS